MSINTVILLGPRDHARFAPHSDVPQPPFSRPVSRSLFPLSAAPVGLDTHRHVADFVASDDASVLRRTTLVQPWAVLRPLWSWTLSRLLLSVDFALSPTCGRATTVCFLRLVCSCVSVSYVTCTSFAMLQRKPQFESLPVKRFGESKMHLGKLFGFGSSRTFDAYPGLRLAPRCHGSRSLDRGCRGVCLSRYLIGRSGSSTLVWIASTPPFGS